MKNVSSAFRNELKNGNRKYIKSLKLTLNDGTELLVDNSKLWQNGVKIDRSTSNSSSFDIGSTIIGQLTLTLNNIYDEYTDYDFTGCVASNIKVGLELPDGTIESLTYGVFYLDEAKYNGSIITLSFYDSIYKFDKNYSESNLIYPATLGQIVRDACSVCGVTLQTTSFDHDDYVVQQRPNDESLTFRQVLQWVGQIACLYCITDEQGRLCMEWYDTNLLESIDLTEDIPDNPTGYHHIHSFTSLNTGLDDVVITGISVTQDIESDDGTVQKTYQSGKDGYVLSISKNKLIQGEAGMTIASMLGKKIIGMRFRTFSASALSDPTIEAGDIIVLTTRKGEKYKSVVTNNVFHPGNFQNISCGAVAPARKSASRYSEITQVYVDYRKDLQKEKTEREKALEELGNRINSSSGVFTTIEKQEDGSNIYYLHNKPQLSESDIVWKMTAEAWGVSTDGGKTYNAGMTVDGDTIVRILTATGVNADWINSGALQITDNDGNLVFLADVDTKRVYISGDYISIGDTPLIDNLNGLQDQINNIEVPEAEKNIYYGENLIKDPYFTKISGEGNMWAVNTGVNATRMGDDYEIKDPLGDSGKIMRIWKEQTASAGAFFGTKPTNNPVLPEDLQDGIFEFTFYARTENTGSGDVIWTTDIYVCVNGYYSSYKKITLNKLWHKYSIKLKCDNTRRSHISFGVAPVTSGESNAILLYKPECYYVGQDIKEGANLIRDPHFDTIKSPVSTGGMWATPNSAGIDVRSYKTSCTHEFVNPNMDTFKDPEGGYGALVVNNTGGVSDCFVSAISNGNNPVITDAGMYRVSVWLKAQYSGKTLKLSLNRQTTDIELSTEWKEYSYVQDVETVNTQGYEMFTIGGFSSWGTNFGNLYIYNPRVEKLYSSEDTFNMLTDFGKKKGLYKIGDQLYFSFDYARGGTLKLGGSNNVNGLLQVYNSSGVLVGAIDNIGAKFTNGSDWLQISQSLLTGGYGSTTDGLLDLSANYSSGGRHVVLESKTGDVILKSQNEFRVERQSGGMGYLVQSGGTDYFDDIEVSFGNTYPIIGIMYVADKQGHNPFLDIRLANGKSVYLSGGETPSIADSFLVRQVSDTVSQLNGYGTRLISLSYPGYKALGIVGYSISSTYHAVYQMNFNQSAQTVTVGIRHVNDTSASSSVNVYCQVLYVRSR